MEAFDDRVKAEREKIKNINDEKKAIIQGVRERRDKEANEKAKKQSGKTFQEVLAEKREFIEKFKAKRADADVIAKQIKEIQGEEALIEKNTAKSYKSGKDVQMRLQEIDNTMQTTSVNPQEERALHKEKVFLEKSLEFANRFDALKPKKKELFDKRKAVGLQIKGLKQKLDEYNETLDKMNEEFKAQKATREDNKEELDALEEKIQTIKGDIGKIIEEKEATKEEHFKQLYECELEEIEFKHIEWMKRQKDRLV